MRKSRIYFITKNISIKNFDFKKKKFLILKINLINRNQVYNQYKIVIKNRINQNIILINFFKKILNYRKNI